MAGHGHSGRGGGGAVWLDPALASATGVVGEADFGVDFGWDPNPQVANLKQQIDSLKQQRDSASGSQKRWFEDQIKQLESQKKQLEAQDAANNGSLPGGNPPDGDFSFPQVPNPDQQWGVQNPPFVPPFDDGRHHEGRRDDRHGDRDHGGFDRGGRFDPNHRRGRGLAGDLAPVAPPPFQGANMPFVPGFAQIAPPPPPPPPPQFPGGVLSGMLGTSGIVPLPPPPPPQNIPGLPFVNHAGNRGNRPPPPPPPPPQFTGETGELASDKYGELGGVKNRKFG